MPTPPYDLTVRRLDVDLEGLPTHWLADSALLTHLMNAQNLLFPEAERFVIRAVGRCIGAIDEGPLRDAVKDFIRQEAIHGGAHHDLVGVYRTQGFDVGGWQARARSAIRAFERLAPAWLCLSVATAMEHVTASTSEAWFTDGYLEKSAPPMALLLGWHAAEEIEHKAVVFDLLMAVEPRWSRRLVGMAIAAPVLLLAVVTGAAVFLAQDPDATLPRLRRERRAAAANGIGLTRFLRRHVPAYLARDFHPNDRDNLSIAHDYLARIEAHLVPRRAA